MNYAIVRQCVFVDECCYNIGRPEVPAGRGREKARTAKCAASVDET